MHAACAREPAAANRQPPKMLKPMMLRARRQVDTARRAIQRPGDDAARLRRRAIARPPAICNRPRRRAATRRYADAARAALRIEATPRVVQQQTKPERCLSVVRTDTAIRARRARCSPCRRGRATLLPRNRCRPPNQPRHDARAVDATRMSPPSRQPTLFARRSG